MAQTSINIKPCKQVSETHNKREKYLDYVRPDLIPQNEWWSGVRNLADRREEIRKLVKEKTGRKMQAKAEPLHEAVVVIKADTTMDQLKDLGKRFRERFGFETVQIAIHRDEGHWVNKRGESTGTKPYEQPTEDDIWKPNYHAHMVFDWYNHQTGKFVKTTKQDASEMQTITAEVLGMDRGVASSKVHLDAAEYKIKAEQEETRRLQKKNEELKKQISELKVTQERKNAAIEALKTAVESLKHLLGTSGRDKEIKALKSKINAISEKSSRTEEFLKSKIQEVAALANKQIEQSNQLIQKQSKRLKEAEELKINAVMTEHEAMQTIIDRLKRQFFSLVGLLKQADPCFGQAVDAMTAFARSGQRVPFFRQEDAVNAYLDSAKDTPEEKSTQSVQTDMIRGVLASGAVLCNDEQFERLNRALQDIARERRSQDRSFDRGRGRGL